MLVGLLTDQINNKLEKSTVEPPRTTTSRRRPPFQNTKNILSQNLILEPLINHHLP